MLNDWMTVVASFVGIISRLYINYLIERREREGKAREEEGEDGKGREGAGRVIGTKRWKVGRKENVAGAKKESSSVDSKGQQPLLNHESNHQFPGWACIGARGTSRNAILSSSCMSVVISPHQRVQVSVDGSIHKLPAKIS